MTTASRRHLCHAAAVTLLAAGLFLPSTADAERLPLSRGWEASIGLRTTFVHSSGYDPYSTHDDLIQLSLAARRVVWFHHRLELIYGIAWDWGTSAAKAREAQAEMGTHRLGMIIEGRYRAHSALAVYGRLVPGFLYDWERINDSSGQFGGAGTISWTDSHWSLALDAALGASARLLQIESENGDELSVWLSAEGGYSFAPAQTVRLRGDLPAGDPRQTSPLDMGNLSLRGGFFRISLSLAY